MSQKYPHIVDRPQCLSDVGSSIEVREAAKKKLFLGGSTTKREWGLRLDH